MSSHGDMFDDETPLLSPLHFPESPEPCIPLMDTLQNSLMTESETTYDESTGLIPISTVTETNPLMSSQQSNLLTYQETSTLSQNPLEMNQIEIGQQAEQESNGFAPPTMTNPHEFPDHLQEQFFPVPLIQEEYPDAYGSLLPQLLRCFPNNNLPVTNTTTPSVTTTQNLVPMQQEQQQPLYAHTLSTREPLLNNQYHNSYGLDQIMVENSEHSSPIAPNNLIPNWSQNYLPNQTYGHVPFTSSHNMYGQQLPPSVLRTYPLQNQTNMIHTFDNVPQRNISFIPTPQMSSNSTRHRGGMQRSVHQSSPGIRFCNLNSPTPRRIRPDVNSIIPPRSGVLGSRQRSYESRFEFGESSSSAQRRRLLSANQNVGSTAINIAQERVENKIYNPIYESLGLRIDPHLRKFSETKPNGP